MVVVALPKETTLSVSGLIFMFAALRITALKYSKQNVVSKTKGVDSVVGFNVYVYTQIQGQINIAHFLNLGTVGGAEQLYILKLAMRNSL